MSLADAWGGLTAAALAWCRSEQVGQDRRGGGAFTFFFFENLGAPSPAAARTPHGPSPTPQALANFISFSQRACFFSSGLCTYFLRLVFTQFSAGCGSL